MSVDEQTAALYVEEARECVRDFEHALLMLESLPDDKDLIARLFRSAHTLKGNSRIMGYDAIATFTHALEDLLDLLRNGDLMITQSTADVLLDALDVVKELIGEVSGDGPHDPEHYRTSFERIRMLKVTLRASLPPGALLKAEPAPVLAENTILSFLDDVVASPEPAEAAATQAEPEASAPSADAVQPAQAHVPVEATPSAPAAPAPGSPREGGEKAREARGAPRDVESSSVRVPIDKLDRLINLTGEVVIAQSMIAQLITDITPDRLALLQEVVAQMDRHCRELQERMLGARMLPVRNVFARFHRLVRDLSAATGKSLALELSGEDTELDKTVIEKITDPLTHLVRNAIDHGVEPPEQRIAAGKPPQAKVSLSAYQKGGSIFIEVSDDGRGIDTAKVLAKAKQKGLVRDDARLSDEEIYALIFHAGFSTADQVTEISGRGVGMDVVKRNVDALKGTITTSSVPGKGTSFRLKLPLTLAILDGLGVAVGSDVFLVPLVSVLESFQPREQDVYALPSGGEVVDMRGQYVPLVRLYEAFKLTPRETKPHHGIVMVLDDGTQKTALLVDELIGQQQVVIKSLETNFCAVPGVSGATVLGDGRVALILDIGQLASLSRSQRVRREARPDNALSLEVAAHD